MTPNSEPREPRAKPSTARSAEQREPQAKPNTSHEVTAARAGRLSSPEVSAPFISQSHREMSGSTSSAGTVYLCGAGPGDPNLLTLRAAHLLATCDVILPDDLVSDEILGMANPAAEIIPVGKRCGQPRITQAGIHDLMLHHASRPKTVLRLKSGDPLIFGRAGEEIDFLTAHNIPFEIVPGITAAFAVAASLKTPLTDRAAASKLILATAHHSATKSEPVAWHGAFPPEATLVLYMPGRDFTRLSTELIASGIPPSTPVAAVSRATHPDEQVTQTTLADLPTSTPGPAPLLLLIGQAIRTYTSPSASFAAS